MTTEKPDEGNPQEAGGGAPAQPSASQAQPLTADLSALEQRLSQLEASNLRLKKENETLQSGKDKRWNEYEPLLSRLKAKYGEDEVNGIERDALLDQLLAERRGQPQPTTLSPARVDEPAAQVEAQKFVSQYNLDPNDPVVAAMLQRRYANEEAAELAVARIVRSKLQPPPSVGPSPLGGQPQPPTKKVDELTAEYKKEMLATPRGAAGNAAREVLKSKYRGLGVDIYAVDFSS
jgi:hypothetical protein